jgi:hypothetical protein
LLASGGVGAPHFKVVDLIMSLSSRIGGHCLLPSYPSHHLLVSFFYCYFVGGHKFQVAVAIVAAIILPICGDGSIVVVVIVVIRHRRHVWKIMVMR